MEMQELANLRLVRMEAEELCEVFDRGDREDLSEFFGSMAEGQARQEAASVAPVPGAVSRDPALDGRIEFKTDNADLFDFALEEIGPAGWKLEAVTRDLHHDAQMLPGNIMTEYEEKFSSLGNPIYKYIIYR